MHNVNREPMRYLTAEQRLAFDAATARFRTTFPENAAQVAVWRDLAEQHFADDLAALREDLTPDERAAALPLLADLALVDTAIAWQRELRREETAPCR